MLSSLVLTRTIYHLHFTCNLSRNSQKIRKVCLVNITRGYAKKKSDDEFKDVCECKEIKKEPLCKKPCEGRRTQKDGILHRIKMRVIEGGTNFGTPFRKLKCVETKEEKSPVPVESKDQPPIVKAKSEVVKSAKTKRPGVQVSILGADTSVGQFVALLLKQCPCIKQLRLYEATDTSTSSPNRDICKVVHDLQHIDTNCEILAFSYHYCQLERCLQQTDIVLMLESNCVSVDMPLQQRFYTQAPIVKGYTEAIASQCPEAFVIVCATPIDCMVPLVAEILRDSCWYDCRKVMGSMAVPEMRASTLAARALCLEPRYTRVPCVGGSEGETLVPLFSRAVEYFSFNKYNTDMLTKSVRATTSAIGHSQNDNKKTADLSEAHALSKLVTSVAHALLCQDVPRVTAFAETHAAHVISPARFIANTVEISHEGITRNLGLPKMGDYEAELVDEALTELRIRLQLVNNWYTKNCNYPCRVNCCYPQLNPRQMSRVDDCAYANF